MGVKSRFSAGSTIRYISVIPAAYVSTTGLQHRILTLAPQLQALFDDGPVLDYLRTVEIFLDGHSNEVLTFLFTHSEGKGVADIWKPIFDEAGLSPMAYALSHIPLAYNDWSILDEMITTGKRVVVFMGFGADVSQAPLDIPEFELIWETPYGITNSSFSRSIDRIWDALPTEDHSLNHNWTFPTTLIGLIGVEGPEIIVSDPGDAEETNEVPKILANVAECAPFAHNRNPNFVLLDLVKKGEAFWAMDILNGFQYVRSSSISGNVR
ncbi:hypothetical protein V5O48_003592 [Marasmius crinis-equi]|uniref:Uncharacterized protein n=1 Tax=Marasmius crinis-equi TaxID=585013 RepID=A0ABR3FTF5_9AGAR